MPIYESTSEWISLGLAGPLRRRAVAFLRSHRKEWVLDSGAGPGVSSRMLSEDGFEDILGLDPSIRLLRFARSRLARRFCPIVGVAENLPFRPGSLGAVITCFSLRDVMSLDCSLEEFARATRRGGALAIVDIGKPDSGFWRTLIGFYISRVMPVLSRQTGSRCGRISSNKTSRDGWMGVLVWRVFVKGGTREGGSWISWRKRKLREKKWLQKRVICRGRKLR